MLAKLHSVIPINAERLLSRTRSYLEIDFKQRCTTSKPPPRSWKVVTTGIGPISEDRKELGEWPNTSVKNRRRSGKRSRCRQARLETVTWVTYDAG